MTPEPPVRGHAVGDEYQARFDALAASGHDVHGEAAFVERLSIADLTLHRVLDGGCGTGRVAIELHRRGLEVVGVDVDPLMIESARRRAPDLPWLVGDLADADATELGSRGGSGPFDVAVLAGNVLLFVTPGTEAAVVGNVARQLRPGGVLVAGFSVRAAGLDATRYDGLASAAGLELAARHGTWDGDPWSARSDYAVSVHRRR